MEYSITCILIAKYANGAHGAHNISGIFCEAQASVPGQRFFHLLVSLELECSGVAHPVAHALILVDEKAVGLDAVKKIVKLDKKSFNYENSSTLLCPFSKHTVITYIAFKYISFRKYFNSGLINFWHFIRRN